MKFPFFYINDGVRELFFTKIKGPGSFTVLASDFYSKRDAFSFNAKLSLIPKKKKATLVFLEAGTFPNKKQWIKNIQALRQEFKQGLKKIVFARYKKFSGKVNIPALFSRVQETNFENAFKFALSDGERLFFGASPEILFHLKENKIFVPAIAGTRKKNSKFNLLESKKELREHALVVEDIVQKLKKLGAENINIVGPKILAASTVEHLCSELRADFSKAANPQKILATLHPTPAMCGTPQKHALSLLQKMEGWDRGFYASPLGFIDHKNNEALFIVGIRSALAHKNRVFLFAGAGILPESNSLKEWEETESKMQTILRVFDKTSLCKKLGKMKNSRKFGPGNSSNPYSP